MNQRIFGASVCTRCGHTVGPRGPNMPRYCATCGHALVRETVTPFTDRQTVYGGAVAALILGILGLVMPICPPVSIMAVILGVSSSSVIAKSSGRYSGQGFATAGFILGVIGAMMSLVIVARCR